MRIHSQAGRGALVVTAAGALGLLAAGCSAGSLGSSSGGGDSTAGSVSITYLVDNGDQTVASSKALIAAFEAANPTIKVTLDSSRPQGSDGDNAIKTKLATGDAPDVFAYNNGSLLAAIKPAQNLTPLDDQPWVDKLDKTFKDSTTVDGKLYGAPQGTAFGGGVLYNKPLFAKLGIEVPKTWDDFTKAADKIKASGAAGVEQTYGDTWTAQLFVLGDFHNVEAAVPDFATKYTAGQVKYATTPAALAGFQHIEQMRPYFNKDFASAKLNDGLKAVATGTAGMYPMLGATVGGLDAIVPGKTNDVGFFGLPGTDAAKNGLTVWPGNGIYIPKTTEGDKLEAAKKFLAFTMTQPGCDAASKGAPPQGPYLSTDCKLPDSVSTTAKDTTSYFDAGTATPALEFKSPIKGPNLEQICVQIGTGQVTAAQGAALYDVDVRKQAQQLGLPGWE